MQLWNNEYPARLHLKTPEYFNLYLNGLSNTIHYLLLDDLDKVNGWSFTFLRENENWFDIILNSEMEGKGNGNF